MFSAEKCCIFKFRDDTHHIGYEDFILDDIVQIEIGKYYNVKWPKGPVLPPKKMQLQPEGSIIYEAKEAAICLTGSKYYFTH